MLGTERGTNVLDSGAYFYDVYRMRRWWIHFSRRSRRKVLH
jgi:hypothetical protein